MCNYYNMTPYALKHFDGNLPPDFKAFDVIEVMRAHSGQKLEAKTPAFFLPAPNTWLEAKGKKLNAAAWFRERDGFVYCTLFADHAHEISLMLDPEGSAALYFDRKPDSDAQQAMWLALLLSFIWCLTQINEPRHVGVTTARVLKSQAKKYGFSRDSSYSVLYLRDHTSQSSRDGESECHKRRHLVRQHIRRYRNGLVVTVAAHWRGDETLGIVERPVRVKM